MTKFLSDLLEAEEPMFSYGMARLERSTGSSGVDTRLVADIIENAHKIMRKLNLDPADTTGHELYSTLKSYVKHSESEGDLLDESDYIMLVLDGVIISFNLIDIIENVHHELEYGRGIVSHGQRSLMGEVVRRYIGHARTDNSTTLDIAGSIGLLSTSDML